MSEVFYKAVRSVGSRIFFHASAPRILHAERAARAGGYILAANHCSPYDAPLIIASTPRVIYWLSIVEIFRNPLAGCFLRWFGAEPLDRSKADTRTVLHVVRHLRAGRVVGIFPEGGLRQAGESVLQDGSLHDGVCKLAQLAHVPVLPCVVVGSEKFADWKCWLPGAGTRWAVVFGEAIFPREDNDGACARLAMTEEIKSALRTLHMEVADYA
jgi:1-acyl-sn-glycerol-3-phosphate acyltransferase